MPLNFENPRRDRRIGRKDDGKVVVEHEDKLEDSRAELRDSEALREALRLISVAERPGAVPSDRKRINRFKDSFISEGVEETASLWKEEG